MTMPAREIIAVNVREQHRIRVAEDLTAALAARLHIPVHERTLVTLLGDIGARSNQVALRAWVRRQLPDLSGRRLDVLDRLEQLLRAQLLDVGHSD